jgi:hypothetical protein
MVSHLFFYQLVLLGLLWLCVMLHYTWPNECAGGDQRPSKPLPPPRKRPRDPKPFPGLTRKSPCAACEQAHEHGPQSPGCPPPRMAPTRGRPRQVDTFRHFCPDPDCPYGGWLGLGNITSNGLPTICQGAFVTFFAPSTRPAYNEFGWHHSPYDDAAWPSGYAGVGRQYCVRPGHAAAPSPATPHTRC